MFLLNLTVPLLALFTSLSVSQANASGGYVGPQRDLSKIAPAYFKTATDCLDKITESQNQMDRTSFVSSATYIINKIIDVEQGKMDRDAKVQFHGEMQLCLDNPSDTVNVIATATQDIKISKAGEKFLNGYLKPKNKCGYIGVSGSAAYILGMNLNAGLQMCMTTRGYRSLRVSGGASPLIGTVGGGGMATVEAGQLTLPIDNILSSYDLESKAFFSSATAGYIYGASLTAHFDDLSTEDNSDIGVGLGVGTGVLVTLIGVKESLQLLPLGKSYNSLYIQLKKDIKK